MNYRRVLVLVDLTAHPAPTFDALASLGSDIESLLLVFKGELESLEAATRSYLGWKRVQATSDSLNLLRNSASRLTG